MSTHKLQQWEQQTKPSDEDSFKYSILYYLHYYDITHHPERISKLKPFDNKYNFTHTTTTEFETDNPNISLTVFNENNEIIYTSNNNSTIKAKIIKINNYRYVAIIPQQNENIKLHRLIYNYIHIPN